MMPKAGETGKTVKLLYDQVGQVFRKEYLEDDMLVIATHYYYLGWNLIQEFAEMYSNGDLMDELTWDYLRGLEPQHHSRYRRSHELFDLTSRSSSQDRHR